MATRPYQGYPYSNPHVHDVPTVDAATASRWNNLPRRPIQPPRRNVVYVDLPEEGSQVSRPNERQTDKKDPEPRTYIDVPDSSGGDVAGPAGPEPEPDYSAQYYRQTNGTPDPSEKKSDAEPAPVIYIDVPDSSSSDVAGPASPEPEPEYVQETIFYDPFENRRIVRQKPPGDPDSPSECSTAPCRPAPRAPRPTPPKTLDLHADGSSGYSTFSSPSSNSDYGRHDDFGPREPYHNDRFRPIPVSPYPEPPPAYSEIDTPHTTQTPPMQTPPTPHTTQMPSMQTPQTPQQTPAPDSLPSNPQEPPRTIVITHGAADLNQPAGELPSPIGLASPDRKVVYCHYCGHRVHTLVIWESGPITHAIAFALFCLMLLPLILLVYWTNVCKYRNHYCPNCNKKIGYEYPALCISMTYTK